MPFEP